jgi:mannosyltransferase
MRSSRQGMLMSTVKTEPFASDPTLPETVAESGPQRLAKAVWRWLQDHSMLCGLIVLAAALRFARLGFQSFWVDEIASWHRVAMPTMMATIESCAVDVQAPGYMVILRLLLPLTGISEAGLRWPAAVAGVICVPLIYVLGRDLYGKNHGLLAAAFTTVFWLPLRYSQQARTYALLFATVTATSILWIRSARDLLHDREVPYARWILYAIVALVQAYLHYYGLYVIALQALGGLLVAWVTRRGLKRMAIAYGLFAAGYAPWVPAMLRQLGRSGDHWIVKPGFITLWQLALQLFNESGVFAALGLLAASYPVMRWALSFDWKRHRSMHEGLTELVTDPAPLLALWIVGVGVPITLFSRFVIPLMIPRYLLFLYIPVYLLCAEALLSIRRPRLRVAAVLVVLVAFVLQLFVVEGYYTEPRNAQFREVTLYVAEREASYPRSALLAYSWNNDHIDLYLEHHGATLRTEGFVGTLADLDRALAFVAERDLDHLWFMSAWRAPEPAFVDALSEHLVLVDHAAFLQTEVWLFKVPD